MKLDMKYLWCIFWTFCGVVYLTGVKGSYVQDPCDDEDHRHLHDMQRRFKDYKSDYEHESEEMVCDKYLIPQHGAWFMEYNDMITEPPIFLDCGTTHPIWLNGTVPRESEGVVDRIACKVGFNSYCEDKIHIKVRRCEKYTAYFLLPTKHCPEAYCFGLKADPEIPKPVVKPGLGYYKENGEFADRLFFQCYMDIVGLNFAYYEVTWKWGDTSNLTLKNESSQFSSLILTDENFDILGTDVTCTVKALHYEHGKVARVSTSKGFFVGLKFTESVSVTKGGIAEIPYHITVPFGCSSNDMCSITIDVEQTGTDEYGSCSGRMSSMKSDINITNGIRKSSWNSTHVIRMKHFGRKAYGVNPSKFILNLQVDVSQSYFKSHNSIAPVEITVHDSQWDHKVCSAINDPHMTTFDNLIYEHQQPGTYILYEHKTIQRHMQVQMELTPCNSNRAYCICGLAVRAGGDVYLMYLCGGQTVIGYASCSEKILQVKRAKRNTKQYKITFPTGTEVNVNIFLSGYYDGTMNVEIRGSGDDFNQSQGLCGKMTGHCNDGVLMRDGRKQSIQNHCPSWQKYHDFSDSWRVKDEENLFQIQDNVSIAQWSDYSLSPRQNMNISCESDEGYKIINQSTCSIGNAIPKQTGILSTTFATSGPLKWNQTSAKSFCRKKITDTHIYKECSALQDINWDHHFDMCWHDILLTDTTDWAEQTAHMLIQKCIDELQQQKHINNTVKISLDILCANNCSSKGKCVKASCECFDGFIGIDCSVSVTEAPRITHIVGMEYRGLTWCDKTATSCNSFLLQGHAIEETSGIACKIVKYLFYENSTKIELSTQDVQATVESLTQVHCDLPSGTHLLRGGLYIEMVSVSVSYNKQNYSSSVDLYIFDSKCQDVNRVQPTPIFILQNDACFISGKCINKGETNSSNTFFACNPNTGKLKWTFDYERNCIIDGISYHKGDKNENISCMSCNPAESPANWTITDGCYIGRTCYSSWSHSPHNGYLICNSSRSTTDWSVNETQPVPFIKVHLVSQRVEFECFLNTTRMNYTYFTVIWTWAENQTLRLTNLSSFLPEMRLTENHITKLGITISCAIEAQYEKDKVSLTFTSNPFYAGVQTDRIINLEKGESTNIWYHLTVPLSCHNRQCRISITITDIITTEGSRLSSCHDDIVVLSLENTCQAVIDKDTWNVSKSLAIKHRASQKYGINPTNFLVKLEASIEGHSFWNTIEIPDVKGKPKR